MCQDHGKTTTTTTGASFVQGRPIQFGRPSSLALAVAMDGERDSPGGPSSARRRREWRLRAAYRHEQMSIRMVVAAMCHHSWDKSGGSAPGVTYTDACMQTVSVSAAPAPVVEYVAPAPAVSCAAPASVDEYLAPAPAVTYAAPAPADEFFAPSPAVSCAMPAPVDEYFAPAPAETYAAPAPVDGCFAPAPAVSCAAPAPVVEFFAPAPVENFVEIPEIQAPPMVDFSAESAPLMSVTTPVVEMPPAENFSAESAPPVFVLTPVVEAPHAVDFSAESVLPVVVTAPVVSLPPVYVARRPPPLVDVWPSVRAQRHVVEQLADIAPMVQILDSPEPLMVVAQLLEVFRSMDMHLPDELAISVPTVSCSPCPSRSRVPEPQSADQLLEVPTVLTPARIAVQIAEQIVGTSVPRGRGRGPLPGQSSRGKAGFADEDAPRGSSSRGNAGSADGYAPRRHDEWVCVVDVVNDGEYYWNRLDNSTCWRLPRGVKHRWCLLPSGLYRDVVTQVDYRVLPPL